MRPGNCLPLWIAFPSVASKVSEIFGHNSETTFVFPLIIYRFIYIVYKEHWSVTVQYDHSVLSSV